MKKILAITTVSLMAISTAHAAEFADLDANTDGVLTFEEVNSVMADVTEEVFNNIDLNQNGALDQDEFAAAEL
ncbi:MAG: hypothetical protein ABJE63_12770 [Lentilitoribacter sp.]